MQNPECEFPYPRRRVQRAFLKFLSRIASVTLVDLEIIGKENFPSAGPLLVVMNHFSIVDPAVVVRVAPWPLDFLGDFAMPNVPMLYKIIPDTWGYYPVNETPSSRYALRAAEAVIAQGGVLGIFPEGRITEPVLRSPHPGAAYVAARTGSKVLPMGIAGTTDVFPALSNWRRAKVTVKVGEPFGPFSISGRGRERRQQLEAISDILMRQIARLLPPDCWGAYADDPTLQADQT